MLEARFSADEIFLGSDCIPRALTQPVDSFFDGVVT